ncbi:hypothetical protein PGIGA_G00224940 [Pangasianodon gigas]|uniref:Uncharacterized protein n=1 Tax=Pangasianodon gigas TaxID=30993 RepID=A0ACC5WJE1_PANGG|nr:hypothetical protein [Pangasianodon gigas]
MFPNKSAAQSASAQHSCWLLIIRSEALPAVGCLLNAALTPWLLSTRLLTICSSMMIDVPTQPDPRRLPK